MYHRIDIDINTLNSGYIDQALLQALAKANGMMKRVLRWVPKILCLAGLTGRRAWPHSDNICDGGEGAHQWPVGCLKKKGRGILLRDSRLSTFLPARCLAFRILQRLHAPHFGYNKNASRRLFFSNVFASEETDE
jgi:hypothetical protein